MASRSLSFVFQVLAVALALTLASSDATRHEKSWSVLVREKNETFSLFDSIFSWNPNNSSEIAPGAIGNYGQYAQKSGSLISKIRALASSHSSGTPTPPTQPSSSASTTTAVASLPVAPMGALAPNTDDSTDAGDDNKASKGGKGSVKDDDDTPSITLLMDDAVFANKTKIIPPEPEQPKSWPATVLSIFLILAVVLLGATVFRNCRKRSQYQELPTTSLIV